MSYIEVDDAPDIPGLVFRNFRDDSDYTSMHEVSVQWREAIEDDDFETLEDFIQYYKHLVNCDPYKDVLIAEVDGEMIAYSRTWWVRKLTSGYNHNHFVLMKPEWWGKGIKKGMLHWNERRLSEIEHSDNETVDLQSWVLDTEKDWLDILESSGYTRVRYGYSMVRSLEGDLPSYPLPPGISVRPVPPEDYRKVWDADVEASKDGWQPIEMQEAYYQRWREHRLFQPEIWQVAWDGDEIAAAVQNFINHEENEHFSYKRGYTENIHVGRRWRGKGLAKALMARSLRILKSMGMEEATLAVDAENPTGALGLYKTMGFEVDKTSFTYRKPLKP